MKERISFLTFRNILYILFVVIIIQIIFIPITVSIIDNRRNDLDSITISRINTISDSIITTLEFVLKNLEYNLNTQGQVISNSFDNSGIKNIPFNDFPIFSNIDKNPFKEQITNFRYSPIVYQDEVVSHETFGMADLNTTYRIYSAGDLPRANRSYYVPIYNQDPINIMNIVGLDLLSINSTLSFFEKIRNLSTFYVAGPINFLSSLDEFDNGFYLGEMICSKGCNISANSFDELLSKNKILNKSPGVSYSAILAREFIQTSLNLLEDSFQKDIHDLEFYVLIIDNITKQKKIMYKPSSGYFSVANDQDSLLKLSRPTIRTNFRDLMLQDNTKFRIGFKYSDQVESNDFKNSTESLTILLIIFNLVITIVVIIIMCVILREIKNTEEKRENIEFRFKTLNHEGRTPLHNIVLNVKVCISKLDNVLTTYGMTQKEIDERPIVEVPKNMHDETKSFISNMKVRLDSVLSNCNFLTKIFEDARDLRHVEEGIIDINIVKSNINYILDTVFKSMTYKIEEHNDQVALNIIKNRDQYIITDINRVVQIIINFIHNAYKFTDSGYIEVGSIDQDNYIIIYVKDTGCGIKPEYKKTLFKQIIRHQSLSEGNGMGLYLSSKFAHLLGGKIEFTSELNKGTTMKLFLPKNKYSDEDVEDIVS